MAVRLVPSARPTCLSVDLDAMRHNYRQAVALSGGAPLLCVVKANAYGHGLLPVSRTLVAEGAAWLGVATVGEGAALRDAGIDVPILLLGGFLGPDEAADVVHHRLIPALFCDELIGPLAQAAVDAGTTLSVHVKVDTGMGRIGFAVAQAADAIRKVMGTPGLRVTGVFSHFASADQASLDVDSCGVAPSSGQTSGHAGPGNSDRATSDLEASLDVDPGGVAPSSGPTSGHAGPAVGGPAVGGFVRGDELMDGPMSGHAGPGNNDRATPDPRSPDLRSAERQLHALGAVYRALGDAARTIPVWHMANSAALMRRLGNDSFTTLYRPGIMLYGEPPSGDFKTPLPLTPVATWSARVIQVKTVPAGTPISYGGTFVTGRSSRIATIPVGYADGYRRALSNKGHVLIHGQMAPLVGRVCMDMFMVDVTDVTGPVVPGDRAVLLGRDGGLVINATDMGAASDTIAYDILCGISERVPRVYTGVVPL